MQVVYTMCTSIENDSNADYQPIRHQKMKEKTCPLVHALELLGGKWRLPILYHLSSNSPKRFKELERTIVGITPTMLTSNLKELERNGLIKRQAYATVPPTVEYSLTEIGYSIIPLAGQIRDWGIRHLVDLNAQADTERC